MFAINPRDIQMSAKPSNLVEAISFKLIFNASNARLLLFIFILKQKLFFMITYKNSAELKTQSSECERTKLFYN